MSSESPFQRDFWIGDVDARPLALLRVGIAAMALIDLFDRLRDFHAFYTALGVLTGPTGWINFWLAPSALDFLTRPLGVGLLFALGILAAAALLVGYRTRTMTFLTWAVLFSIQMHSQAVGDSGDQVLRLLFFWGLFADLGAVWSADVRLGRRAARPRVFALPLRILQLQVAIIYGFAAFDKTKGAVWRDGSAVARALRGSDFVRPLGERLAQHLGLCRALTRLTVLVEGAFPFLVFSPIRNRAARAAALSAGVAFHVGIYLTMRVGLFSPIMLVSYLPFVAPEWIDALTHGRKTAAEPRCAPPRPSRWTSALVVTQLAAVLVGLVAHELGKPTPYPLYRELSFTGLAQGWNMFAPGPPTHSRKWEALGTLTDGRHVDALSAQPELQRIHGFIYSRWYKLRADLAGKDSPDLQMFGNFLCRRYNDGSRTPLLARFDLVVTQTPIRLPGELQAPSERITLLHQPCLMDAPP